MPPSKPASIAAAIDEAGKPPSAATEPAGRGATSSKTASAEVSEVPPSDEANKADNPWRKSAISVEATGLSPLNS